MSPLPVLLSRAPVSGSATALEAWIAKQSELCLHPSPVVADAFGANLRLVLRDLRRERGESTEPFAALTAALARLP